MDKYILNDKQLVALKNVHKRVMESGLTRIGIPLTERERFLDTSNATFDLILKETQELLTETAIREEVMNELKKG